MVLPSNILNLFCQISVTTRFDSVVLVWGTAKLISPPSSPNPVPTLTKSFKVATPLTPNEPVTSNYSVGLFIPIPTFPVVL